MFPVLENISGTIARGHGRENIRQCSSPALDEIQAVGPELNSCSCVSFFLMWFVGFWAAFETLTRFDSVLPFRV